MTYLLDSMTVCSSLITTMTNKRLANESLNKDRFTYDEVGYNEVGYNDKLVTVQYEHISSAYQLR